MSEPRGFHTHADGTCHIHDHTEGQGHTHTHSHTQTRAVINRLARAIGHLESVKRMVESGRDCTEVLMQLAAVQSALNNTAKVILKDHIEHCLFDIVEQGDRSALCAERSGDGGYRAPAGAQRR